MDTYLWLQCTASGPPCTAKYKWPSLGLIINIIHPTSPKDNVQTTEPDATAANSTNVTNAHKTKGIMSDNSTATSKTKTSSNTNRNGSAPKTKKGTLDPNRLPDSSGDSLDNVDSMDIDKD